MHILARRRRELKLSQREVAKRCGLTQGRLSEYESGSRRPTRKVWEQLCQVLQLTTVPAPAALSARLRRKLRTAHPTVVPAHSSEAWERTYRQRANWVELLHRVPSELAMATWFGIDSPDEGFALLQFVDRGARLCAANPHELGFAPHCVLDHQNQSLGGRLLPALLWGQMLIFSQVSLRVDNRLYRVDGLVLVDKRWVVYELDGPGHAPEYDIRRDRHIGLPVFRIPAEEVYRLKFPERFAEWWEESASTFQEPG